MKHAILATIYQALSDPDGYLNLSIGSIAVRILAGAILAAAVTLAQAWKSPRIKV